MKIKKEKRTRIPKVEGYMNIQSKEMREEAIEVSIRTHAFT